MAFEPTSPLDLASAPTPELPARDSMMGKVWQEPRRAVTQLNTDLAHMNS